jgi:hypothetical protein
MWLTTLVLGMHRSGTSATAGALSHLGLNVGSEERLFPPSIDNPFGFFEASDITLFNDSVLAHHHLSWTSASFESLSPFDVRDVQTARHLVFEVNGVITCVKDPRLALLIPLWRSALLDRIACVVVLRDPREVVWSLVVRNGLTPVHAAALWFVYNAHIAEESAGLPKFIVHYETLVSNPESVMGALASFLAENGALEGVNEEQISLAAKSINPKVRRATFPAWLEDHLLVSEAISVYESVKKAASLEVFNSQLDERNQRLRRLCSEVIRVHRENSLAPSQSPRDHRNELVTPSPVPPLDSELVVISHSEQLSESRSQGDVGTPEVRDLVVQIESLRTELRWKEHHIMNLEQSRSLRIGRVITKPVRFFKKLLGDSPPW